MMIYAIDQKVLDYWQEIDIKMYEKCLIEEKISHSNIQKMKISTLNECRKLFKVSEETSQDEGK